MRQKQIIEAYHRVQAFLADHPPSASPGCLKQKQAFDEIVASLDDHAVNQVFGRRTRHFEVGREQLLTTALREEHLAPISRIARAILADAPGIERALKMPAYYITTLRLIAEANAMRNAAALYEEQFVDAGRPAAFLEQLEAATETLRQCMLGKARNLGLQVGAGAGLEREIQRGRSVLEILDTIVRDAFHGNEQLLEEWRSARRVRAVPGGVALALVEAA
jgi:hypothetical protein